MTPPRTANIGSCQTNQGDLIRGRLMASRLTAVVVLWVLLNACASPRVVRLDTGDRAFENP